MLGETARTIGQILSIVAVATGFISFQMKTPRGILIFQLITALIFSTHYFLIGATSATALNLMAAVQCLFYYLRNKRNSKSPVVPIVFTALMIASSILTWDGWYSVFIMAGLVINTVSLGFSSQTIRKLNLVKSPLCLTYNVCVFSIGGIIYEAATFVSAIIGLFKYSKQADILTPQKRKATK